MKYRGFTILEALVAIILLGIVITGLAPMFKGAKSSQVGSYAVEQGSQFAESRIDSLRSLGRTTLLGKQSLKAWTTPAIPMSLGISNGTWQWMLDTPTVSGKPHDPTAAGKAGVLTVRVLWRQGNTPHQIELQGAVP